MRISKIWLVGLMVSVIMGFLTLGTVHAQTLPDLGIWVDSWFKLSVTNNVYHFDDQAVKPRPPYRIASSATVYLHITGVWTDLGPPERQGLYADVYHKDDFDNWDPFPIMTLDLEYFAGSDLKFVCSTEFEDAIRRVRAQVLFRGKLKTSGNFKNKETVIRPLGGYITEIDDVSTERQAGSIKISGFRVPLFKVPPVLLGL